MRTGKKVFVVVLALFSLTIFSCIPVFAESATEATQPQASAEPVSPQLLADVREASATFRFCYKSDDDVYRLFEKYFPSYKLSDYNRFFVSIPTSAITFYFIPTDCNFSGTSSVLRFDKPCLKLTYGFTTKNYVATVIQPSTYFSSGNSAFRNFNVVVDGNVLLPSNIEYFYSVNVDATMSLDNTNDYLATIVNRLDMVYTVQLVLIGLAVGLVVCVLLYKFIRQTF